MSAAVERFRERIVAATGAYLRGAKLEELNTPRPMLTWQMNEQRLAPVFVILRTVTHLFQHQGQVVARCRLLGRPAAGMDFPIA